MLAPGLIPGIIVFLDTLEPSRIKRGQFRGSRAMSLYPMPRAVSSI